MTRCSAKTKEGKPCKRSAAEGKNMCAQHSKLRVRRTSIKRRKASSVKPRKACRPDQVRNSDTGRCNNVSVFPPCASGSKRSRVTNRCSKVKVLAPCAPGKTRDSVTNRCKK